MNKDLDLFHTKNSIDMLVLGKEMEGPRKGMQTLFIKNLPSLRDIASVLQLYPDTSQLYFGAGVLSKINWLDVSACIKLFDIKNYAFDLTHLPYEGFIDLLEENISPLYFYTIHLRDEDVDYNKRILLANLNNPNLYVKICTKDSVNLYKPCTFDPNFPIFNRLQYVKDINLNLDLNGVLCSFAKIDFNDYSGYPEDKVLYLNGNRRIPQTI